MPNRTDILQLQDIKIYPIEVPQWGCTLHVKSLTGTERAKVAEWAKDTDLATSTAKLVALALCDEAGKRVFTDEDVPALSLKNGEALEVIATAVVQHNGLSAKAVDDAKND